ncbi:MAG: hypothetical protein FWD77_11285 [Betaproteobacteria bacterium]|nr:hypothetical protein [Betaproteobacteria bacterium]
MKSEHPLLPVWRRWLCGTGALILVIFLGAEISDPDFYRLFSISLLASIWILYLILLESYFIVVFAYLAITGRNLQQSPEEIPTRLITGIFALLMAIAWVLMLMPFIEGKGSSPFADALWLLFFWPLGVWAFASTAINGRYPKILTRFAQWAKRK